MNQVLRRPAVLKLREAADGASDETLAGGPLGQVTVDAAGCTLCGSCTLVCPTGALRLDEGPLTSSLEFNPTRCIGCGHCQTACPEEALTVSHGLRIQDLAVRPMKTDTITRCRNCGSPVGPSVMVKKVKALLPDANPELIAAMTELCSDCKGTTTRA